MSANLGVDTELNVARTTTSAAIFFQESISALDKALRSTRNAFGDACKLAVGTAKGNVPVLDNAGKLDPSVVPKIDLSKVITGTFGASQIPQFFAEKIGAGTIPAARFRNLPATKIRFGRLTALQLPVGWSRTKRPTSGAAGGPGIVERTANGRTIGVDAAFVGEGTSGTEGTNPTFRVQGSVSGNVLKIQLRGAYPGRSGIHTSILDLERKSSPDDRTP